MRTIISCLALSLLAISANAEQSSSFGDYTVHYNALTTNLLDPKVAKSYNIRRSTSRALLNVSVLRKKMGVTGEPVRAKVVATAANLNSQLRIIEMRELNEREAIYYIGELPVNNEETLKFSLEVTPAGETEPHVAEFEQIFFTE